uniref:RxLR effector candidate protein n=1 Tax=Hyaloperonospora arabidopsidis (strain Emoy2) TaxID=559515 RepID=A0A090BGY1_HYAAE|nr:RxLR effector candidate protein [Hyaloperonospora arabidopsidis Emoy2]
MVIKVALLFGRDLTRCVLLLLQSPSSLSGDGCVAATTFSKTVMKYMFRCRSCRKIAWAPFRPLRTPQFTSSSHRAKRHASFYHISSVGVASSSRYCAPNHSRAACTAWVGPSTTRFTRSMRLDQMRCSNSMLFPNVHVLYFVVVYHARRQQYLLVRPDAKINSMCPCVHAIPMWWQMYGSIALVHNCHRSWIPSSEHIFLRNGQPQYCTA